MTHNQILQQAGEIFGRNQIRTSDTQGIESLQIPGSMFDGLNNTHGRTYLQILAINPVLGICS